MSEDKSPATPEGDAISRVLPNAYFECESCTNNGSESNCRPADEIRHAPSGSWLCEYCYDDAAYECGEDANWPVWADLPKLSASLPPQPADLRGEVNSALPLIADYLRAPHMDAKREIDERAREWIDGNPDPWVSALAARAEKAEAALADNLDLLRFARRLTQETLDEAASLTSDWEDLADQLDAALAPDRARILSEMAADDAATLTAQPVAQERQTPTLAEVLTRTRAILSEVPPQVRAEAIAQLAPAPVEAMTAQAAAAALHASYGSWRDLPAGVIKACEGGNFFTALRIIMDDRAQSAPVGGKPTHRHVKRGTEYRVIGTATVQGQLADYEKAVVYQDVADGGIWVRGEAEFKDGRFAPIAQTGGAA